MSHFALGLIRSVQKLGTWSLETDQKWSHFDIFDNLGLLIKTFDHFDHLSKTC